MHPVSIFSMYSLALTINVTHLGEMFIYFFLIDQYTNSSQYIPPRQSSTGLCVSIPPSQHSPHSITVIFLQYKSVLVTLSQYCCIFTYLLQFKILARTSLVIQWLTTLLPMHGTRFSP